MKRDFCISGLAGKSPFLNLDFILAFLACFFLYMSISMFFLLPLFLEEFSSARSQIGLIMGIHSVVAIIARPFFGRLIDRHGGKKFAALGLLILISVTPLFHLVKDAGWFPLILSVIRGLGWGISMTATIAVCSDLSPVERIAQSMGIIGVSGLVANALGPLIGEWIITYHGYGGLFNASLVFLLVSLALILKTKAIVKTNNKVNPSGFTVLSSLTLWVILITFAMTVFHGSVRGAMIYFVSVFASSIGINKVGPFFLSFSLAAILTRLFFGDISDRVGRKKVIFPAAAIISANLIFLSQVKSSQALILAGFIGGLGQGLIYPALSAYLIDLLGFENKGLAISIYLSLFDLGMGLGSPLYGVIADMAGYRIMYIIAGLILFVFSFVFNLKAPSADGMKINLRENNYV